MFGKSESGSRPTPTAKFEPMRIWKSNTRGASLAEYSILLGIISVVAIIYVAELGTRIKTIFEDAAMEVALEPMPNDPFVVIPGTSEETPTGTSVTPVIPGGTDEGDMMIAFVTHRSALTDPPGWERVTQEAVPPARTTEQWLTVLAKRSEASDGETVEFTQALPGRLLAHIVTVEGEDSRIAYHASKTGTMGYASTPNYYAMEDNTLVLAGRSAIFSLPGGTASTVQPPEGWVMSSQITKPDNRQSVAYRTEPQADVIVPSVHFVDDVGPTPWATVLLQVRRATTPDPDEPDTSDPTGDPILDPYDIPRDPTGDPTGDPGDGWGGPGGTTVIVRNPDGGGGGGGGVIVVSCPPEQWTWNEERWGYEIQGVLASHDYVHGDHNDMIGEEGGTSTGFVNVPLNHAVDLYEIYEGRTLVVWGRYLFTRHLDPYTIYPPHPACR